MFGKFKKVSTEEQRMLAKVAMDLIDKISENNHLLSGLSGEQFIALRKYEKAAQDTLSFGQDIYGSDNMIRGIWDKAFKELTAALKIVETTIEAFENSKKL